ncbi:hypothetical protein [Clostridium sp. HBUAS56010]|nr:hypothetical protein [Clostridium sp. HBUAS56010]
MKTIKQTARKRPHPDENVKRIYVGEKTVLELVVERLRKSRETGEPFP